VLYESKQKQEQSTNKQSKAKQSKANFVLCLFYGCFLFLPAHLNEKAKQNKMINIIINV